MIRTETEKLPESVKEFVRRQLSILNGYVFQTEIIKTGLGGDYRYLEDLWLNKGRTVERAYEQLDRFEELATENGINAEQVYREMGGKNMTHQKLTLTNDFHNTETTISAQVVRDGLLFVSEAQATKARETLCGSDTCLCGNSLGERPAPHDCVPTTRGYLYYR